MVKVPFGDELEIKFPEMSIEGSMVEDPKGNIAAWGGKRYRMIPPSAGKLVEDPAGDLINEEGKRCKLIKPTLVTT